MKTTTEKLADALRVLIGALEGAEILKWNGADVSLDAAERALAEYDEQQPPARWRAPQASPELLEAARARYGSDDIEIDDDARTSTADEGTWVQAWVWVAGDAT